MESLFTETLAGPGMSTGTSKALGRELVLENNENNRSTSHTQITQHNNNNSKAVPHLKQNVCTKCHRHIREMYVLLVDDQMYHEDCLRCSCCDARLAELDKLCYRKANMMLCKRDYLRLYGNTGFCAACDSKIQAFEYVMKARDNTYHLDCFTCHLCKMRFCVGDKFYLNDTNKILCEKDHNIITFQPTLNPATLLVHSNLTPENLASPNNHNLPWFPHNNTPGNARVMNHHYHHLHNHTHHSLQQQQYTNKKINTILDKYNNNLPNNSNNPFHTTNNHPINSKHLRTTIPTSSTSTSQSQSTAESQSHLINNNQSPSKFEDVSSGYNSPSPTCGLTINT